jgi:hypothetical protein
MTALPASLSRWRQQLRVFADDLATVLGRLVVRLAPAFDSVVSSQADPDGDVDGFDGITNRGSYERLLASEWMLREALPLEFMRRAAGGEQAFFHIARRQPAVPQSTLALFDAGPDQLGGCRIVQLALLVLLVQQAESTKQKLRWQLLHHVGEQPLIGLDEPAVRTFLNARTGLRSSENSVQAWAEQAARRSLWLVGPRSVTGVAPPGATRVTLTELVNAAAQVSVTMDGAKRTQHVVLELPNEQLAARLLRDPFATAKQPLARASLPASNLLLSPPGSRLYYRDARGDLIAVPIGNSPRAPVAHAKRYQGNSRERIASISGRGRKIGWLSHARGVVALSFADHTQQGPTPWTCQGPLLDPPESMAPFVWFPSERMAVFEAADRSLWRADFRTNVARPIAEGVRAWLLQRDNYLVAVDRWLERNDGVGARVLELKPYWAASLVERALPWQDAKLASAASWTLGFEDRANWELQEWTRSGSVPSMTRMTSVRPAAGEIVLGIEAFTSSLSQPGLWLLDDKRREVRVLRHGASRRIITTNAPIEQATLANAAQVLALTTTERELLVVDIAGRVRYRGSTPE